MKAVLSNRIYLSCDESLKALLDKELTYLIPSFNPSNPPIIIKNLAEIRPNLVTIPIGRTDLIPKNFEVIDKRIQHPINFPEFKGLLRPSQQEVYDNVNDNCIINAKPSWGKTFTGLSIAAKLGQKTLIIVHTTHLRNQWVREYETCFEESPGVLGGGESELDAPVVIGNTQTLYRRIKQIEKAFGCIILDEMHHVSSPTFGRLLDTNYARYKLGLSGTIERKDGKHVVFRDYFGSKVLKPSPENYMTPDVHIITSGIELLGGHAPWPTKISNLIYNEDYQHLVAMAAAAYAAKGHKVLVLSSRIDFLEACAKLVGPSAICVTGKVDQTLRMPIMGQVARGDYSVLCGTQSIFSEGISEDSLSCVVLAEPLNNMPLLEQIIGRIQRVRPNKLSPVVIDIHLSGKTAKRQASNRIGFYMKQGFNIKHL